MTALVSGASGLGLTAPDQTISYPHPHTMEPKVINMLLQQIFFSRGLDSKPRTPEVRQDRHFLFQLLSSLPGECLQRSSL
jgi:hypothetical protein